MVFCLSEARDAKEDPTVNEGYARISGTAMAKAVTVCPDGNENLPGGNSLRRNTPIPAVAASVDAPAATNRNSPPKSRTASPIPYQSQPSPPRVAQIIHGLSQRGAFHQCTRLISCTLDAVTEP
jgi:hypothetical protein